MNIPAAVIHEAVNAESMGYSIVPVAEEFRILRVIPDAANTDPVHTFNLRLFFTIIFLDCRPPAAEHCCDHQSVRRLDLEIQGGWIYRFIDRLAAPDKSGMLSICYIDDTDRISHRSVDVVLAFGGLVKGHMEESTSVEIIKSHYIQVFDIAFIAGSFGVKFGCHGRSFLLIQTYDQTG